MIRIATIGTSMITSSLLEVLNPNPRAVFVGTCSRDAQRAEAFTQAHGGDRGFSSVEDLAASSDVDAVYIGSPNAIHYSQALACVRAGKHVLVEKPVCANQRQAAELFNEAAKHNVVALEAMRPLHDPALRQIRDALPRLGTIRRTTLRFGKYSSRYTDVLAGRRTNIFDCAMASGALMDIGVYCVEPLVALFGKPQAVQCAAALLDDDTRGITGGAIDGAGVICASYPGHIATLHYSKITSDLAENQIEGELGTLTFSGVSMPSNARIDLRETKAADSVGYSSTSTTASALELPSCPNTMAYELDDFIDAVLATQTGARAADAPAGWVGSVGDLQAISLESLEIMDAARRQAGVVFPSDKQDQ